MYRPRMRRSISFLFALSLASGCGDDGGGEAVGTTGMEPVGTTEVGTTEVGTTVVDETSSGGDSSSGGETSSSSSSTGVGTSTGEALLVTISGAAAVFGSDEPVADADVCWIHESGSDLCTTTDSEGAFELADVPGETQGALRFSGEQIAPFALILQTEDGDITLDEGFTINPPEVIESYYQQTAVERVDGSVVVFGHTHPMTAGVSMKVTPLGGAGPFYAREDPSELDTGSKVTAASGIGMFLNIVPGDGPFESNFSNDTTVCEQGHYGAQLMPWAIPADVDAVGLHFDCE